jgi:hypothetical protein
MITLPIVLLAVSVGVVLAALDGPYAFSKAHTERVSVLLVAVGAATVAAGGAVLVRDWLLG